MPKYKVTITHTYEFEDVEAENEKRAEEFVDRLLATGFEETNFIDGDCKVEEIPQKEQ